jgi:hypothetical protein
LAFMVSVDGDFLQLDLVLVYDFMILNMLWNYMIGYVCLLKMQKY